AAFSREKTRLELVAIRWLEEAKDRGLPEDRRGEGLFLLGKNLFLSGDEPGALPILESALEGGNAEATEIHRLLSLGYTHARPPKLERALEHNASYLAEENLLPEERHIGLLERGDLQRRLGELTQAAATLDEISPEARRGSEMLFLRGRIRMQQAEALRKKEGGTLTDTAREMYRQAMALFSDAQKFDNLTNLTTPKALLFNGNCHLELDEEDAALEMLDRILKRYYEVHEHFVARLEKADLLRRWKRDAEALAVYRELLVEVTDRNSFQNPWITI